MVFWMFDWYLWEVVRHTSFYIPKEVKFQSELKCRLQVFERTNIFFGIILTWTYIFKILVDIYFENISCYGVDRAWSWTGIDKHPEARWFLYYYHRLFWSTIGKMETLEYKLLLECMIFMHGILKGKQGHGYSRTCNTNSPERYLFPNWMPLLIFFSHVNPILFTKDFSKLQRSFPQ